MAADTPSVSLQLALDEILHDEGITPDDLACADDLLATSFWTNPSTKVARIRTPQRRSR